MTPDTRGAQHARTLKSKRSHIVVHATTTSSAVSPFHRAEQTTSRVMTLPAIAVTPYHTDHLTAGVTMSMGQKELSCPEHG